MKIGVVTSSYPRFVGDGSATFVQSLCQAYERLGHNVVVIAPDDAAVSTAIPDLPVRRFRYAPRSLAIMGHGRALVADTRLRSLVPLLVPTYTVSALATLLQQMRHERFDWVQAQWLVPSGIIAALACRIGATPFVVTLQGSDVYVAQRMRTLRPLVRFTLREASAVCAVSSDLALRCAALGPTREAIRVIPNGVDVDRFQPQPIHESAEDRGSKGALRILAVGRLVRKKGFEFLLRAFARVLAAMPTTRLLVAGDGDLRGELMHLAENLEIQPSIEWLSHVPWQQMSHYYISSDLCVFPAVRDSCGNVDGLPAALLEAMACGKPIVGTRTAGIAEAVRDGIEGVLVEPNRDDLLADAMLRILGDSALREAYGWAARERVVSAYTWDRIGRDYVDLAGSLGEVRAHNSRFA